MNDLRWEDRTDPAPLDACVGLGLRRFVNGKGWVEIDLPGEMRRNPKAIAKRRKANKAAARSRRFNRR